MNQFQSLREVLVRRRCVLILAMLVLANVALSFHVVRGWAAYPLWIHDEDARGDAAYVMADGYASWERLRDASDLYHMHRVPRILIMNEREPAGYNFIRHRSETRVERVIAYLGLYGVPRDKITAIEVDASASFGSLSEARAVAASGIEFNRLVVVTTAPHTRRSRLSFQRSLPADVRVDVYSPSEPYTSSEIDAPLWIEYCKLVVYYFVA